MKKLGIQNTWDIAAAVMAILLYVNFLVFAGFCVSAVVAGYFELTVLVVTAVFLIIGIICHLVTRSKTSKLWRRLLLGSIAANLVLIIIFILITVVLVLCMFDYIAAVKKNG